MRSLLSGKPKRLRPQRCSRGYFINQVVVNTQLTPGIIAPPSCIGAALITRDSSQLLTGKSSNGVLAPERQRLAPQTDNTGEKLHTPLQHGTPMLPSKERWPKPLSLPVRTAEKPDGYQRSTTDSVFLPPWVMPKTNRQKRASQCQAQLQQ
jgi:hypothetical protein